MRRSWFQDDDGTYFRNCPLIEGDRKKPINLLLPWRARILTTEWRRTFAEGVMRADRIGRFDRVATMVPFREAYPDHPGLWTLDERP
jgi:hypothetical protein